MKMFNYFLVRVTKQKNQCNKVYHFDYVTLSLSNTLAEKQIASD